MQPLIFWVTAAWPYLRARATYVYLPVMISSPVLVMVGNYTFSGTNPTSPTHSPASAAHTHGAPGVGGGFIKSPASGRGARHSPRLGGDETQMISLKTVN